MDGAAVSFATVLVLPENAGDALLSLEADRLGAYRIDGLRAGRYTLRVRRIGYREAEAVLDVREGEWTAADFRLERAAVDVDGITVEGVRDLERERALENAGRTTRGLAAAEVKRIPGPAEADPLRAIEVLPGVVSTSDFTTAFNVRGSSADQNLILLDGTPIFNPFHLGGFFSVFSADMVARADLHAGGLPAHFGGRVGSVLEVESDPGTGDFAVDAGASLLAARVAVGGGFPSAVEDAAGFVRTRWRVSGRRTWLDRLLRPAFEFPYHAADVQGIIDAQTAGGGRLTLSGYKGSDVLDLRTLEDFPLALHWTWGNDVIGARWTSDPAGGVTGLHLGYSGFSTAMVFPDFDDMTVHSRIERFGGGIDVERRAGSRWAGRTGGSAERFVFDNRIASGGTELHARAGDGTLLTGYLQGEWRGGSAWIAEVGVRGSGWLPSSGDPAVLPSPRLALKRIFAGGDASVSASAGRYAQFLHSLRDEELPLGLDIWVLSGEGVPHVVSDQAQVALELRPRERILLSLEVYARTFDGVATLNPVQDPNDPLDDFLSGTGRSHGVDFMVRKSAGGTDAWGWMLAVSWLRAERTFPDTRSGLTPPPDLRYPPVFDRRLNVDAVLQGRIVGGIDAGLRWNFGTGLPFTRPLAGYHYFSPMASGDGRQGIILGPRNASRYPAYHRLDVSFRRDVLRSWGRLSAVLDILNVYDRRNVLFYHYSFEDDPPTRSGISMFPVLPTFGFELSF